MFMCRDRLSRDGAQHKDFLWVWYLWQKLEEDGQLGLIYPLWRAAWGFKDDAYLQRKTCRLFFFFLGFVVQGHEEVFRKRLCWVGGRLVIGSQRAGEQCLLLQKDLTLYEPHCPLGDELKPLQQPWPAKLVVLASFASFSANGFSFGVKIHHLLTKQKCAHSPAATNSLYAPRV